MARSPQNLDARTIGTTDLTTLHTGVAGTVTAGLSLVVTNNAALINTFSVLFNDGTTDRIIARRTLAAGIPVVAELCPSRPPDGGRGLPRVLRHDRLPGPPPRGSLAPNLRSRADANAPPGACLPEDLPDQARRPLPAHGSPGGRGKSIAGLDSGSLTSGNNDETRV